MSIEAMTYVLGQQVGDGTRKLVLLAFANHAHRDGTAAWCSVGTVAEYAERGKRTIQVHVSTLVNEGWMREGDQRLVEHLPKDRRPIVYDLSMTADQRAEWVAARTPGLRDAAAVAGQKGGTTTAARNSQVVRGAGSAPRRDAGSAPRVDLDGVQALHDGVQSATQRGAVGCTQTVLDPSVEPSLKDLPSLVADATAEEGELMLVAEVVPTSTATPFERFYAAYPRKVGKIDAERAFEKATRRTDAATVIAAAERFAADPNLPSGPRRNLIPHPATWLNKGRFLDEEPLAPEIRNGRVLNEQTGLEQTKHDTMTMLAQQYEAALAAENAQQQRRIG